MFLQTVSLTSALAGAVGRKRRRTEQRQVLALLLEGCVTKGADRPDWRLGEDRGPQSGNTGGLGSVTRPPSGRDDTAASDPTSREVQLLRTTKQNKGARRGKSHGAFQSPPAPSPQPAPSRGAQPAAPLAADQGLGSPWSPVSPRPPVTAAREAAEGQPGMGKPDGSIPPPPSLPPGARGLAALRRGPARPGSPQGKGCLCLKVTTRARCPGWAWCLPFPGRGGGDGGPPQIPEGDKGKVHLPPHAPTPSRPPSGTCRPEGRGSAPLTAGGQGTKSTLFIV